MTTQTTSPAWAKGRDVGRLKEITAMFKDHDAGMVHGPFGRYSEVALVADLDRDAVAVASEWAVVARVLRQRTPIKDFTGETRLVLDPGTRLVSRMAWTTEAGEEAVQDAVLAQEGPLAVWAWQEHAAERALVAGLDLAAVKVSAASEMRGLYVRANGEAAESLFDDRGASWPYPPEQSLGLGRLPFGLPSTEALVEEATGLEFAQHYSGYNKGGSWTALALRGFYDESDRIEKPAEMNKRWKSEHSEDLGREPRDTPLRALLPACEPLLAAIPCAGFERVRLMRLAPGGGELTRHADITDAAAGAAPGRIVRVHVPLVSNPDCVFHGWDLDGRQHRLVMAPGGAYYLDTRKPHTAINNGTTERLHLVADVVADERLCSALAEAEEAPAVE